MSLLPKSHQDFSKTEYWNTFFKKRGTKAFEWYGEYFELSDQIHKYMKIKDDVLMVGCGNSTLSVNLYDVGFTKIINIDISQIVIKQMLQMNKEKRPGMQFIHMDALEMTFNNEQFSVVFDKGTLDALMTDDSADVQERVNKYFSEISRVLRFSGRYICVSLLQAHILKKILEYFPSNGWMIRIVRCIQAEKKNAENDNTVMPVFIIVATKFKKLPQMLLEISLNGENITRVTSPEEITNAVKSVQNVAVVTNGLVNNKLDDGEEVSLELFNVDGKKPRYTLYFLDQPSDKNGRTFGALIVPHGRELEWLFSTTDGRKHLLKSAGFSRLAIICMHRDEVYDGIETVKSEISASLIDLAPREMKGLITFVSLGSDLGKREVIHKSSSKISGDFVIEEVCGENNATYRRLIFLNNQFVIQSESRLKTIKSRKGRETNIIDPGYLACGHHIYMTIGIQLALQSTKTPGNVAVIGLGGGGLCTFLHKCFDKMHIIAIDIDSEMLDIAKKFFGFACDDKLKVSIEDGIEFLQKTKNNGKKLDAILFDVDSKDSSLGMSCPPKQFVNDDVLNNVKTSLSENGFFILNLVCRDNTLKSGVITNLKKKFNSIASYKMEEDVNEVIFCTNTNKYKWNEEFKIASEKVNENVIKSKLQNDKIVNIEDVMESLHIDL